MATRRAVGARARCGLIAVLVSLLSACAGYGGQGFTLGHSTVADVERMMGAPAMHWQAENGEQVRVYPRGPMGFHTWMLRSDASGRLLSQENVLDPRHFARIAPGMDELAVLQLLGPPIPAWTVYFSARDERVWEWRYCDDWGEPARFNVLFDGTTRRVRSTLAASESQRGLSGHDQRRAWCHR